MPVIWIPAQLRDLTGGLERVTVEAETVRQAIDGLDRMYPGIRQRLYEEDRLRPNLSVLVDGVVSTQRLRQRLGPTSEVHILPVISGG